jgi:hypothetical protein
VFLLLFFWACCFESTFFFSRAFLFEFLHVLVACPFAPPRESGGEGEGGRCWCRPATKGVVLPRSCALSYSKGELCPQLVQTAMWSVVDREVARCAADRVVVHERRKHARHLRYGFYIPFDFLLLCSSILSVLL